MICLPKEISKIFLSPSLYLPGFYVVKDILSLPYVTVPNVCLATALNNHLLAMYLLKIFPKNRKSETSLHSLLTPGIAESILSNSRYRHYDSLDLAQFVTKSYFKHIPSLELLSHL